MGSRRFFLAVDTHSASLDAGTFLILPGSIQQLEFPPYVYFTN